MNKIIDFKHYKEQGLIRYLDKNKTEMPKENDAFWVQCVYCGHGVRSGSLVYRCLTHLAGTPTHTNLFCTYQYETGQLYDKNPRNPA